MTFDTALYVVATPIGNLNDITLRAIETLSSVHIIAAEDTRHSKQLLQHLSISTPMLSLHEHNEQQRIHTILEYLAQGKAVALISDAGTPVISDPGYPLVTSVHVAGYPVISIPGPCALIAALSISGMPVIPFTFYGFLPRQSMARQKFLKSVEHLQQTLVFYESSHRLKATIEDMQLVWGEDRIICVAKELTKQYETIYRHPVRQVITWLTEDDKRCKGEFVLIVEKVALSETELVLSIDQILKPLVAALPPKQASQLAAEISGLKKNDLYRKTMTFK